jgi:hypothetical protein
MSIGVETNTNFDANSYPSHFQKLLPGNKTELVKLQE